MRVVRSCGIIIILASHLAERTDGIPTIREHDIVSYLHVIAQREDHFDVGVLTSCARILLLVPLALDRVEIVEAFGRPVDISTPAQMDEVVVEPVGNAFLILSPATERHPEDPTLAVESSVLTRTASVEPRTLANALEDAIFAAQTKPTRR